MARMSLGASLTELKTFLKQFLLISEQRKKCYVMSWTDYYLALFGLPAVLIIWMMMVPLLFMFLLRVPMTRCLLFFLDYQVVLGTFTWVMEISRKLRQSVLKALPTQTRKRKGKKKKKHTAAGMYCRMICCGTKWKNWKTQSQPIDAQGYSCFGFTWSLRASLDRFSTSFS